MRQCQVGVPQSCPSAPLPQQTYSQHKHLLLTAAPASASPSPASSPPALSKLNMLFLLLFALQGASFSAWEQQCFAAACCWLCKELSVLATQPQLVLLVLTAPGPSPAAASSSPVPTQFRSTELTGAHGSNARDKKLLHLSAITFTAGLPHAAPHALSPQAHCSAIPSHSEPPGSNQNTPMVLRPLRSVPVVSFCSCLKCILSLGFLVKH